MSEPMNVDETSVGPVRSSRRTAAPSLRKEGDPAALSAQRAV